MPPLNHFTLSRLILQFSAPTDKMHLPHKKDKYLAVLLHVHRRPPTHFLKENLSYRRPFDHLKHMQWKAIIHTCFSVNSPSLLSVHSDDCIQIEVCELYVIVTQI